MPVQQDLTSSHLYIVQGSTSIKTASLLNLDLKQKREKPQAY